MAGSEVSKRSNGEFQFNLKAGNRQVIGTSKAYADEGGCDNGIASVKSNAPAAAMNDQTD
ncbi:MAG: YegP family protein [Luteimonas sp.]